MKTWIGMALAAGTVFLAGCGVGGSGCTPQPMVINPAAAVADHNAPAPGNQQQFIELPAAVPGCPVPAIAVAGPLTSPDPGSVAVTSNGLATCLTATNGPVTLTSTLTTKTATLTCK